MGTTSAHFSERELQCHGTNCGPLGTGCKQNKCTVMLVSSLETFRDRALMKWLWKNPGKTSIDFPGVRVIDAYRCVQHNAATSGAAAGSMHPDGKAADLSVDGLTAAELEDIAGTVPAFKGIGRDDIRNMIHVDVRYGQTVARWCYYRNEKGVIAWGAWHAPSVGPVVVNA